METTIIKGVDSRKVKFATTYADLHTNQEMRADVDRLIGVDSGAAYAVGDPIDAPVFEEIARRWNAFESDGEVAQLRAENEKLRKALGWCASRAEQIIGMAATTRIEIRKATS